MNLRSQRRQSVRKIVPSRDRRSEAAVEGQRIVDGLAAVVELVLGSGKAVDLRGQAVTVDRVHSQNQLGDGAAGAGIVAGHRGCRRRSLDRTRIDLGSEVGGLSESLHTAKGLKDEARHRDQSLQIGIAVAVWAQRRDASRT